MKKIKILFIIDFLGGGGAQRVVSNILKFIDRSIFKPELAVLTMVGDYMNSLPNNIIFHNMNIRRSRYSMISLSRVIKKVKPQIIFSTNMPPDKIKVIPNPIDIEMIEKKSIEPINDPLFQMKSLEKYPIIMAMGRLAKQKGFSYLLRAFKIVRDKLKARLVILGEGEKKNELENLAQNLNISTDVSFIGFKSNPYKYLSHANLFVLSSLWEGFPNAIIEAMACGTPVISTNCSSGPKEIITSCVNGLLVPPENPEEMAKAILEVLTNKKLSEKIVEAGSKKVNEFDIKKIMSAYENLFIDVIK